jgi:hypothetical protein
MKINNRNFTIVFAIAVLPMFFLFASRVNAQNIRDFVSPHIACQFYYNQQGFKVTRDLEHDCVVQNGDSQTGFVYTHYYDSGNDFCLEVTSSFGRIFGPQCMPISQTGRAQQQQQENPDKIVTPPSFQIKELQYDTLPTGKQIQAGDNERIEITMPDGSLIQLDANATFTPVSDYEVQSVFGRYRYMWKPFHDGNCIVGQNLVRQACRKVTTRDAVLGVRGTEFLVETDESGTSVTVLEGLLGVADLAGKKTVEVAGGQSTYIKHGGLPEEPKSFDPAEIDRWWEKKTPEQIGIIFIEIVVGFVVFIIIVSSISRIFGKKKPVVPAVAAVPVGAYCVNCGAKILEGAAFCNGCGKPIAKGGAQTPPIQEAPVGKKPNVFGVLLAIIIIIIVVIFLFKNFW